MFSRGAASKESKRRHFPTRYRSVSNPFTFRILKRTTLPAYTPSKEELSDMVASGPKAEQRRSFGTCSRSLNRGTGGTSWGVDRASGARGVDHRPVECWMAESPGLGSVPAVEGKRKRNPKVHRHTISQDHTSLVYYLDLLWHVIVTALHPPVSHRRHRQLLLTRATTKGR